MKKTFLFIVLIIGFSTLFIYFITLSSQKKAGNGFDRKIISANIALKNIMELPNGSFGFAGKLDTNIKLNNYSDKLNLYQIGYSLKKLDTIVIDYPSFFNKDARNIYKNISPPYIYCTTPYGDIMRTGPTKFYYKLRSPRFNIVQAVSPNNIIVRVRSQHSQQLNLSLAKLNLSKEAILDKEYHLPNLDNGLISNDGILLYDNVSSKIFYMYFYRGEFISLDSNLNMKYISKTIDTISTFQMKTAPLKKKGKEGKSTRATIVTPPKFVNGYITTDSNKVYIYSRLKAENETESEYIKNQSIDVYNIDTGKYLYSFHIPKYFGKNLKQFQIRGNVLVAIFGTSLVTYTIDKSL